MFRCGLLSIVCKSLTKTKKERHGIDPTTGQEHLSGPNSKLLAVDTIFRPSVMVVCLTDSFLYLLYLHPLPTALILFAFIPLNLLWSIIAWYVHISLSICLFKHQYHRRGSTLIVFLFGNRVIAFLLVFIEVPMCLKVRTPNTHLDFSLLQLITRAVCHSRTTVTCVYYSAAPPPPSCKSPSGQRNTDIKTGRLEDHQRRTKGNHYLYFTYFISLATTSCTTSRTLTSELPPTLCKSMSPFRNS